MSAGGGYMASSAEEMQSLYGEMCEEWKEAEARMKNEEAELRGKEEFGLKLEASLKVPKFSYSSLKLQSCFGLQFRSGIETTIFLVATCRNLKMLWLNSIKKSERLSVNCEIWKKKEGKITRTFATLACRV